MTDSPVGSCELGEPRPGHTLSDDELSSDATTAETLCDTGLSRTVAVDGRIAAAWSGHRRVHRVEGTDDSLNRVAREVALIRDEVPTCFKKHVAPEIEGREP